MSFLKKLLGFFVMIFILSVAVFLIARLSPGDPLRSYYGESVERMSVEEKSMAKEKLGLDKPIYVQYFHWVKEIFHGNGGISFKYKRPVFDVIGDFYGNTLVLGGISMIITFSLALLLGSFCAKRENTVLDKIICKTGTTISAVPSFWVAMMLVLIFSVNLKILPSSGAYDIGEKGNILNRIIHMILPLAVLVLSHLWYYGYTVRNMVLAQASQDYILVAKAKGLSKNSIIIRHIMPNIMPTYISMMVMSLPHILTGTYIVEKVFSYPGLGNLCFEAVTYHDYNMLMIICLITAIFLIILNEIGNFISKKLNPQMARGDNGGK